MDTYKASGRNPYNCNMNDRCNQNRQMNNYNRQMSMNNRPMSNQHNHQLKPHQCMEAMPILNDNSCDCKDDNHHIYFEFRQSSKQELKKALPSKTEKK